MRSIPRRNSHELALLNGEPVLAQELENRCGGDPDHSRAREVVVASGRGGVTCVVCGSPLGCAFGRRNRWYFRSGGRTVCDHEGETLEDRLTKGALKAHFERILGDHWSIEPEILVAPGLRTDLCLESSSGIRVALELQHSEMDDGEFEERRRRYREAGVHDVWMLTSHNVGSRLVRKMAATDGQRPLIVSGWTGDVREVVPSTADCFSATGEFLTPASPWELRLSHLNPEHDNCYYIDYPIEELRLSETGVLITPANEAIEGLLFERQREAFRRAWEA